MQGFPLWEQAKLNSKEAPQLHIFTLANIVQRPILVYAHTGSPVGYVLDQNIILDILLSSSGIYLPLLWCAQDGRYPSEAHPELRNPLALAYDGEDDINLMLPYYQIMFS